jgi:hypothetical protein
MLVTFDGWQAAGDAAKVWAEFIAYGSAGVFLIYKILSGYFITDLSLKIGCERLIAQDTDDLSVTAYLRKGEKGTIRIHDARARLSDVSGNVLGEKAMIGVNRLSYKTDASAGMNVTFDRNARTPWLSLPPGDDTQFAVHFRVPSPAMACVVEVVILGRKLWGGRVAQWRASAISFPRAT